MAGPEDSWRTRLEAEGYRPAARCRAWVFTGRTEMYCRHLSKVLRRRRQMVFEHYIRSGQKWLRQGYTTGTAPPLAAAGATRFLLTGSLHRPRGAGTPKGLGGGPAAPAGPEGDCASCAWKKTAAMTLT